MPECDNGIYGRRAKEQARGGSNPKARPERCVVSATVNARVREYARRVSFLLELSVERLTEEQGHAVELACRNLDAWPVHFVPRRRRRWAIFGSKMVGPRLSLPEQLDNEHHLLGDDAEWDAPAWAMEPALLPRFAATMRILGECLPQGFTLRATWVGSEVREERELDAGELANLVLASGLNEFTRYRVPATSLTEEAS
jgi:hypothetical protein